MGQFPLAVLGQFLLAVDTYQARTLWLTSERLGITAKIDVVEGDAAGNVVPIEYKRGKAPDLPDGAYLPERAQLCAQVLLLREHGCRCGHGDIYFAGSRKRVTIAIDDALIATTLGAVANARRLTEITEAPPPLVDSPKCNGCSLVGICLPDEINMLRGLERGEIADAVVSVEAAAETVPAVEESANDPWGLGGDPEPPRPLRRLHPASDEKVPLYVQDQGARVGLDGDCLVVRGRQGPSVSARLPNTSHVVLYGNIQVSAQAMRALRHQRPQAAAQSLQAHEGLRRSRAAVCVSLRAHASRARGAPCPTRRHHPP